MFSVTKNAAVINLVHKHLQLQVSVFTTAT